MPHLFYLFLCTCYFATLLRSFFRVWVLVRVRVRKAVNMWWAFSVDVANVVQWSRASKRHLALTLPKAVDNSDSPPRRCSIQTILTLTPFDADLSKYVQSYNSVVGRSKNNGIPRPLISNVCLLAIFRFAGRSSCVDWFTRATRSPKHCFIPSVVWWIGTTGSGSKHCFVFMFTLCVCVCVCVCMREMGRVWANACL